MSFESNILTLGKIIIVLLITVLVSIIGAFVFVPIADLLVINKSAFFGFGGLAAGFVGVLMSFGFCFSVIIATTIKKFKYHLLTILFLLDLLPLYLVYGGSSDLFSKDNLWILVILFITMIAGWLIGEGVVRLYKIIKK